MFEDRMVTHLESETTDMIAMALGENKWEGAYHFYRWVIDIAGRLHLAKPTKFPFRDQSN